MSRVYNFSAGPAVLPEEVLKEVADEMMDYNGTGMSVMEMSHRSAAFQEIIDTAEKDLRELMNIPDNYKVLFLQGGASPLLKIKPSAISRTAVICRSARMQTTYTSVRTTPFTAQNSKNFQTQKVRLW